MKMSIAFLKYFEIFFGDKKKISTFAIPKRWEPDERMLIWGIKKIDTAESFTEMQGD